MKSPSTQGIPLRAASYKLVAVLNDQSFTLYESDCTKEVQALIRQKSKVNGLEVADFIIESCLETIITRLREIDEEPANPAPSLE